MDIFELAKGNLPTPQLPPPPDQIFYNGRIMYPPRPKISIPPSKLKHYEDKGYVAQYKYNGTRTLVEILPGGEIKLWTRHKTEHKAYKLSKTLRDQLAELHIVTSNQQGYLVLDGELMHSKTKGLKDTFIAYDLLVFNDEYLIGAPYMERYALLNQITGDQETFEKKTGKSIAIYIRSNFWLAPIFLFNFAEEFDRHKEMDEIEGLVLKRPKAPLERGFSQNNNSDWMIRCRKQTKNYLY